jgi:hypothetical protein
VSEPQGSEERRQFVEELERRTEHAKRLLDEIEHHRQEAERQGLIFTAPTAEQLRKKLARANSPMIAFQGWSGSTTPGGAINYILGINNPDPNKWISLFAHVFVGPANVVPKVGPAMAAVDSRFPRLTMPGLAAEVGLSLDPGVTKSLNFSLDVPAGVEPSCYIGNMILFQSTWFDVGEYLDRSLFIFEVT